MGKGSNLTIVTFALAMLMIISGQESSAQSCPSDVAKEVQNCQAKQLQGSSSTLSEEGRCRFLIAAVACMKIPIQKCTFTSEMKKPLDEAVETAINAVEAAGCIPKYISRAEISSGTKTVGSIATLTTVITIMLSAVSIFI